MKQSSTYSIPDQNWQWPEKTWFRERLNAIKAREQENRRKHGITNQTSDQTSDSSATPKDQLKID